MNDNRSLSSVETIAAISTAAGQGGIGVVRISGPSAVQIANRLTGTELSTRELKLASFLDDDSTVIDSGLLLFFKNPHSYTGEDVVELQGHGSPVILDVLLRRVLSLGARMARPGEFTERAFLNGKLDLAQAEAVSDLIASGSEIAARAAVRSLGGVFSKRIVEIKDELIGLRVYIEAALDFAEEEIDFLSSDELTTRATTLQTLFSEMEKQIHHGTLLRDGLTVVIAGPPNAGKSSLLNQLTGDESAIVAAVAGTTRDVLRELIQIDGLPVRIIDTAGLHDTEDPVEREGIRRAHAEILQADRLLWIDDANSLENTIEKQDVNQLLEKALSIDLPKGVVADHIVNKIDLANIPASSKTNDGSVVISLSAKTGEGVDLLRQHLKQIAGYSDDNNSAFIARRRHLDALTRASSSVQLGLSQLRLDNNPELAAEDFRDAQSALSEITGEFTSDDLLGEIFAGFCIGK